MKKQLKIGGITTVILLLLFTVACQRNKQEVPALTPVSQEIYEPDQDFVQAKKDFAAHQYEQCARDIRKAIPYMQDIADLSDDQGRAVINKNIGILDDLADDVIAEKVDNEQELAHYFNRAYAALAQSQIIVAENLMKAGKHEEAHNMMASVLKHFDQNAKYLATMPNPLDKKIAQDIMTINEKLEKTKAVDAVQFQAYFKKLKEDMVTLQDRLTQYNKQQQNKT